MFIKRREIPVQVSLLRVLKPRHELLYEYSSILDRAESGLIGEEKLDYYLKKK
ncbi:hypothetical protein [Jeotgalibaca caeni]|uniref:hypothetical protein n=1 Tax=Jeotgalibaca caeni TaxID=3028623 RepID=UPI00237D7AEF|nr:hypothetical protein [Jeotgalibaca caeni]MDE1548149.1 hypothetical protein [Jeotgalibaca caeni]